MRFEEMKQEVEDMAKKNDAENVENEKTFEDYKEAILGSDKNGRTVDDWNALLDDIMRSKGLTDTDKERLAKSIQMHIEDMNEQAQKKSEEGPEPVIINDGLRNGRKNQKVMAVSSKTEHTKVLGYCTFQTVGASSVPNEVVDDPMDSPNNNAERVKENRREREENRARMNEALGGYEPANPMSRAERVAHKMKKEV